MSLQVNENAALLVSVPLTKQHTHITGAESTSWLPTGE